MAKRKRRKIGAWIYGIFLALYAIVLAAGIYYALSKVWTYAEEYEAARPEPVIEKYVANLRENLWDDTIEETIAGMPHDFQTNEEVLAVVQSLLTDEISYSRVASSGDSSTIIYNLYCGKNLFGQVTLVEDKSHASELSYDMFPWMIGDEEFYFSGLYTSAQITVPAAYSVRLNGIELSDDYIIEEGIHYNVLDDYYEAYPNLPTKVTYRAENLIGHLDFTVYDEDGNETVIDPTQDDSQFIKPVEGELLERFDSFARGFVEKYRKYSAGLYESAYGYSLLLPYVELGSDLDQRLKMAMDGQSWSHTYSVSINYVNLDNAISLGEGYYILEISSEATAYEEGRTSTIVQNLRVVVSDIGGEVRAIMLR